MAFIYLQGLRPGLLPAVALFVLPAGRLLQPVLLSSQHSTCALSGCHRPRIIEHAGSLAPVIKGHLLQMRWFSRVYPRNEDGPVTGVIRVCAH